MHAFVLEPCPDCMRLCCSSPCWRGQGRAPAARLGSRARQLVRCSCRRPGRAVEPCRAPCLAPPAAVLLTRRASGARSAPAASCSTACCRRPLCWMRPTCPTPRCWRPSRPRCRCAARAQAPHAWRWKGPAASSLCTLYTGAAARARAAALKSEGVHGSEGKHWASTAGGAQVVAAQMAGCLQALSHVIRGHLDIGR